MKIAKTLSVVGWGIVLLASVPCPEARGQRLTAVPPGSRAAVQLVVENRDPLYQGPWLLGRVDHLTVDSLYFRLDEQDQAQAWLRESVRRMQVSTGTHGHGGAGVALGALVGIPIGLLLASTAPEPTGWTFAPSSEQVGAFFAGLLGSAVIGGVAGSQIRSEDWRDADLAALPPLPDSSRTGRAHR
jgi:hypothetical protein